jgi:Flp pilus assembly protein TadG
VIGRIRRAARRDEGAAAVEFALIFPIFALIAFGTIAAGFAFSRQINITQAAREASRYGSTLSFKSTGPANNGTIDTWLPKVDAAAVGSAGDGVFAGLSNRCVAYVDTAAGSAWHSVNGGSKVSGPCPGTTAASAGLKVYVQVVLERQTNFNIIIANPDITLRSVSTTPYEAVNS